MRTPGEDLELVRGLLHAEGGRALAMRGLRELAEADRERRRPLFREPLDRRLRDTVAKAERLVAVQQRRIEPLDRREGVFP